MNNRLLPVDLQVKLDRILRQRDRGLLIHHEATNELLGAISYHAYEATDPYDAAAIEALTKTLTLAAATSMAMPFGVLAEACRTYPPGNDAALDTIVASAIDGVRTLDDLDLDGSVALVHAWLSGGGQVSAELADAVDHAEPLSEASWLRYLIARNRDDRATQLQVVAADVQEGCPASLLIHLNGTGASRAEIALALAELDTGLMQDEERWGDLASIAVFLAERGWFAWARDWSAMIPDDRIVPIHAGGRDSRHHHILSYHTQCDVADDARVFAPLALIDLQAGDPASAALRIARSDTLDHDLGVASWGFAGHRALINWVHSRLLEDADARRQLLESINPRHSWLGLLRAQIASDLADLAAEAGDRAGADELRDRARRARNKPDVELHVGAFPYDRLLRQLPIVMSSSCP